MKHEMLMNNYHVGVIWVCFFNISARKRHYYWYI